MLYREQAAHGQSPSDKRHESRAMILACTCTALCRRNVPFDAKRGC